MSSITKRFASPLPPSLCYILHPCGFRTKLSHVVEVVNLQLFIRHNEMTWIEKSFFLRKNWSGLLWSHNLHSCDIVRVGSKKRFNYSQVSPKFLCIRWTVHNCCFIFIYPSDPLAIIPKQKRDEAVPAVVLMDWCVLIETEKREQFTLKNIIAS